MQPDCPLCEGEGGWTDHELQQSVICPICADYSKPIPRVSADSLPTWWTEYKAIQARYFGPRLIKPPTTIIIHRGVSDGDIASYFQYPGDRRKVSAHFVVQRDGEIIQCVPLDHKAYHAGSINGISWGIETQGPMFTEFPEPCLSSLEGLIRQMIEANPYLTRMLGHCHVAPARRRDPGPEFPWGRFEGIGLELPPYGNQTP